MMTWQPLINKKKSFTWLWFNHNPNRPNPFLNSLLSSPLYSEKPSVFPLLWFVHILPSLLLKNSVLPAQQNSLRSHDGSLGATVYNFLCIVQGLFSYEWKRNECLTEYLVKANTDQLSQFLFWCVSLPKNELWVNLIWYFICLLSVQCCHLVDKELVLSRSMQHLVLAVTANVSLLKFFLFQVWTVSQSQMVT